MVTCVEEDIGLKTIKEGLVTTIKRGKSIDKEDRVLEMIYLLWSKGSNYILRRVNLISINPSSTRYNNLSKELAGVGM